MAMLALAVGLAAAAPARSEDAGPAGAVTASCANPAVTVTARSEAEARRICAVAEELEVRLASCDMGFTDPVRVRVVARLDVPHPQCLAQFDCATGVVAVSSPERLAELATPDSAFALLPVDVLFASLVAHELTHALFFQAHGRPESVASAEYLPYAQQVAALPPDWRAAFLAQFPSGEPVFRDMLNPIALMFSPGLFAARAWRHFTSARGGCGFVEALGTGRITLAIPEL